MKTLIVTGASKGIGFAVAQTFLAAGYRVINLSRTPALDERIENHKIDLALSDAESQLKELMELLISDGEICLVHNAARLINDSALDAPHAAWFKHHLCRLNPLRKSRGKYLQLCHY